MPIEDRKIENVQTLLTMDEKKRLVAIADAEDRTMSEMSRILILKSLKVYESSLPGRKRRAK